MTEHDETMTVEEIGAGSEVDDDAGGGGAQPGAGRNRRERTGRRGGGGLKAMMAGLFDLPEPKSRVDAETEAALEIEQAATPAMERLVLSVPGASTPEEALARIRDSLPAREVPSEPAPAEELRGAEVAQTLALYQVRRHLQNYQYPTAHEQELSKRVRMRTRTAVSAGGLHSLR